MSFFGEFKNSLKEGGTGDLGGRYFAKVIAEVIKENPWFLSMLYDGIPEKVDIISVEEEKSFDVENDNSRRSDLEIEYTIGKTNKQTLCIEIKWKDNPTEGQIRDYIHNINNKENAKFLLLTLHELENRDDDISLIDKCEKAKRLTCPELYKRILKNKKSKNNWLIEQFIQFLKENAMIYETKINKKALIRFMKNTIGWSHSDGLGKNLSQSTMNDYPTLLRTLLSNIHTVSLEIYKEYTKNKDINIRRAYQSPYTDFFIQSDCSNYQEHQAGYFSVGEKGADEGKFIIQSRFKTDKYLAYGIFFYFHKNKSKDKDGKNQKFVIELFTFANTYEENTSKSLGYHKTQLKFDITDLDKDDEGNEIITFPEANVLLEKIQNNIKKVKNGVS